MCRRDRWKISCSSCSDDRISVREPARTGSPVLSIPGSCVQSFEQHEVAGHVADALAVVAILLVSEMDLYLDMV